MSSYVQFMESAGARVVPLIMGEDWSVTLDKITKLDGILLPGGSGDYKAFAKQIFDTVKSLNDQGTFYPLWGTCLGFQNLARSAASGLVISALYAEDVNLPLEFIDDPTQTKMFGDLGASVYGF